MAFGRNRSVLDLILNGRDETGAAFKSVDKRVGGLDKTLKRAGAAFAAYFSAREAGAFFKDIVTLASDAEEAASLSVQIFGDSVDAINQRLDIFSDTAGRSRYELREMAGQFGALIKPMGFAEDQAANMSVQLTKLTSDLSSFFNTSDEQAATALRAGLVGESEPLRKYGVQLSAARIQQEAFNAGLAATADELTPAIKAQAAMNIIMQDTGAAQGDAIRTAGGLANQVKRLKGEWEDLRTELGQEFIPVALKATSALNDLLSDASQMGGGGGNARFRQYFGLEIMQRTFELIGGSNLGRDSLFQRAMNNLKTDQEREARKQEKDFRDRIRRERDARREQEINQFVGPLPQQANEAQSPGAADNVVQQADAATKSLGDRITDAITSATEQVKVSYSNTIGGPVGFSEPTSPVTGQLITGLAQLSRQGDYQRQMLSVANENKSISRDLRDIVRQIQNSVDNGQGVLVGAFSN